MARMRSEAVDLRRVSRSPQTSEPTLASSIADRLRADIVSGMLAPGEKLRLEHLTSSYGAGRTPLREACCRLAAEGLVAIEDQRGFRVSPISRADLKDLTRTRQQIEQLALRSSIQHGNADWEREVTGTLQRLNGRTPQPMRGASEAWEQGHARLHEVLLSACDSPLLLRFHQQLFEQSERYRRLAAAEGQPERDVAGEHTALVHAALARDAERACALIVEHIARTTDRVLAYHPALAT